MTDSAPKKDQKDQKKKDQKTEDDLSVEDKELKEMIDGHCERLMDNDMSSLKELITIVRSATTALTSVPKPFKFLKTHYQELTNHYNGKQDCP